MFQLIDTDRNVALCCRDTEEGCLVETGLEPADVVPGAESWEDVIDAAEGYDGGLLDLLEGYKIEEVENVAELPLSLRMRAAHHVLAGGGSTNDALEAAGLTKRQADTTTYDILDGDEVLFSGAIHRVNQWITDMGGDDIAGHARTQADAKRTYSRLTGT